jgi:hypothetical protein
MAPPSPSVSRRSSTPISSGRCWYFPFFLIVGALIFDGGFSNLGPYPAKVFPVQRLLGRRGQAQFSRAVSANHSGVWRDRRFSPIQPSSAAKKSLESTMELILIEASNNKLLRPSLRKASITRRRLLVRWEFYPQNFLGFVQLACLLILFRRF